MIVLHRPVDFLSSPTAPRTIGRFFERAEAALRQRGEEVRVIEQAGITPRIEEHPGATHLAYHTRIQRPGIWNVKVSYLPEHFSCDPLGYAGWSTLGVSGFDPEAVSATDQECLALTAAVRAERERLNRSKYPQPTRRHLRLLPYVFVPTQVVDDAILALGRASVEELVRGVVDAFRGTGWLVAIKRHPKCESRAMAETLRRVGAIPHVRVVDASVHDLLRDAGAVVTINSGVGFEALLYLKHVFTLGRSDYESVTHRLGSIGDLRLASEALAAPVEEVAIARFLWYHLRRFTISVDDDDDVFRHALISRITHGS